MTGQAQTQYARLFALFGSLAVRALATLECAHGRPQKAATATECLEAASDLLQQAIAVIDVLQAGFPCPSEHLRIVRSKLIRAVQIAGLAHGEAPTTGHDDDAGIATDGASRFAAKIGEALGAFERFAIEDAERVGLQAATDDVADADALVAHAAVRSMLASGALTALRAAVRGFYPAAAPWSGALAALRTQAPAQHSIPESPCPNLVVSLPRSGLNWLRYCVERITGIRTPGTPRVLRGGDTVAFHRSHNAMASAPYGHPIHAPMFDANGRALYERCVLLLRDPVESFVRHAELDARRLMLLVQNLQAFEAFPGERMLVRYEDLVSSRKTVLAVIRFLRFPLRDTAFDWNEEQRRSLDLYRDYDGAHMGNRSWTGDGGFDTRYHGKTLPPQTVAALEDFLRRLSPGIHDRYLVPYFEARRQDAAQDAGNAGGRR